MQHTQKNKLEAKAVRLAYNLSMADNPAKANTELNRLEAKLQKTKLKSFPQYITLPMTNVCNARCIFCHYEQKADPYFVTTKNLKKLSWLRYVENINLNGGYGDSLANPYFAEIITFVRNLAPYSNFQITTNGIGLCKGYDNGYDSSLLSTIVNNISFLLISLNASTALNWSRTMYGEDTRLMNNFDKLCKCIKLISSNKSDKLRLGISMVIHKDNIMDINNFISLGYNLGVDLIILANFQPVAFYGRKKLPIKNSLYYIKKEAKKYIDDAKSLAANYNISLIIPEFDDVINANNNVLDPCWQPFNNCLLTNFPGQITGNDTRPCCKGFPLHIDWSYDNLDEKYFKQHIWNHPILQYIRRTQFDHSLKNEWCNICKNNDIFNPDNIDKFLTAHRDMQPIAQLIDIN